MTPAAKKAFDFAYTKMFFETEGLELKNRYPAYYNGMQFWEGLPFRQWPEEDQKTFNYFLEWEQAYRAICQKYVWEFIPRKRPKRVRSL